MTKTLLKSGKIITAADVFNGDILIEGEKIRAVGKDLSPDADTEVMDVSGKFITPGGVDVHAHFDLPMFDTVSSDDHYTGHKAAAFGGTTTVFDFISQDEPSLAKCVENWHAKADSKAAIDFGFHMNITSFNEQIAQEIPTLRKLGVNSLKVFTAYNGRLRLQDGDIFRVLRIANKSQMLVMLHAENGDVIDILVNEALQAGHTTPEWHALTRPADGAVESVFRAIQLAKQASAALYIVHMNTAGGVQLLKQAREAGLPVMGETCPSYLFFTIDDLKKPDGAKWICSPPMRSKHDNQEIMKYLGQDVLQVIATDHCPFFFDGTRSIVYEGEEVMIPGKELGKDDFTKIPNGLPGIGDRMLVMWNYAVRKHLMTPQQFVAMNCTNPAHIFGIYPQKGTLMPGSDADIVIWDQNTPIHYGVHTAQHRTDYNLFEGWEMQDTIQSVFLRGKRIVENNHWLGKRGQGKYLYCNDPEIL
ncbi:MAG: D-hydantoinase [Anaerolinea thermophila]|uniref:D-hydantoinase n=1 Tax=Anaerolinea thermophila TaxID=167964 RepID=A0A101FXU5_9CHLR|nr:MAG: D-hydantoinase [Anaerolinea thermophila]